MRRRTTGRARGFRTAMAAAVALVGCADPSDGRRSDRNPITGSTLPADVQGGRDGTVTREATAAPATGPATASTAPVANPLFAARAAFGPGASAAWGGGRTDAAGRRSGLTARCTPGVGRADVWLTESVAIDHGTAGTTSGWTVPPELPGRDVRHAGTADVTAMGRTFHCEAYDLPPTAVGLGGEGRVRAYLSATVPGGVVKLVVRRAGGPTSTLVLDGCDPPPR